MEVCTRSPVGSVDRPRRSAAASRVGESGTAVAARPHPRDALLAAAYHLIERGGTSAVTTREVARAAGVAEGSIYRHFTGRSDLIGQLIASELTAWWWPSDHRLPVVAGRGSLRRNLELIAREGIAALYALIPLLGGLFGNTELRTTAATAWSGRRPLPILTAVADYLRAERELGRIAPDVHVETVAFILVGVCWHHVFSAMLTDRLTDRRTDPPLPRNVAAAARALAGALLPVLQPAGQFPAR